MGSYGNKIPIRNSPAPPKDHDSHYEWDNKAGKLTEGKNVFDKWLEPEKLDRDK